MSKHISSLKEKENRFIEKEYLDIYSNYYSYILELNKMNKSSSKNFYIVLRYKLENFKSEEENKDRVASINLSDMYFKIKESLSRCGNLILDICTKEEIEEILFSFFNARINI